MWEFHGNFWFLSSKMKIEKFFNTPPSQTNQPVKQFPHPFRFCSCVLTKCSTGVLFYHTYSLLWSLPLSLNYSSHSILWFFSLTEWHSLYPGLSVSHAVDGKSQPTEKYECKKLSDYDYHEPGILKWISNSSVTFSQGTALRLAGVWDSSKKFK